VVARLVSRNDCQPRPLAHMYSCADCASVQAFEHLSQGPFDRGVITIANVCVLRRALA
jgi:hypothetical protein